MRFAVTLTRCPRTSHDMEQVNVGKPRNIWPPKVICGPMETLAVYRSAVSVSGGWIW